MSHCKLCGKTERECDCEPVNLGPAAVDKDYAIEALRTQLAETDAALQAAIQRAEEAEARSEKAYEVIRRVGDHVDRMREGEMSYSIVDRVRECRTQRDALQARVGKLEEWVNRVLNEVPCKELPGDLDLCILDAALASREGGEG